MGTVCTVPLIVMLGGVGMDAPNAGGSAIGARGALLMSLTIDSSVNLPELDGGRFAGQLSPNERKTDYAKD